MVRIGRNRFVVDPDEVASDGDCLFNSLINLGGHAGNNIATLRYEARAGGGAAAITTPSVTPTLRPREPPR